MSSTWTRGAAAVLRSLRCRCCSQRCPRPCLGVARCLGVVHGTAPPAGPGGGRLWPVQNQLQLCTALPSCLLWAVARYQRLPTGAEAFPALWSELHSQGAVFRAKHERVIKGKHTCG